MKKIIQRILLNFFFCFVKDIKFTIHLLDLTLTSKGKKPIEIRIIVKIMKNMQNKEKEEYFTVFHALAKRCEILLSMTTK